MSDSARVRAFGRCLRDFEPLSSAERLLLVRCQAGEITRIHLEVPRRGTTSNRVRASFLRFLALGGDEDVAIHEQGIEVWGAWITGILDLSACTLDCRITLAACRLERVVAFGAVLKYFDLANCRVMKDIDGDGLRSTGSVRVRGTHVSGQVSLTGVSIGGMLDCVGSEFDNPTGVALRVDNASIDRDLRLADGFWAKGSVVLTNVSIGGNLLCNDSRFEGAKEKPKRGRPARITDAAIRADAARISGAVFLSGAFRAVGEVSFVAATIGVVLHCQGQFLNSSGDSLCGDQLSVGGNVLLRHPFRTNGSVCLNSAKISGNLECDGAVLAAKPIALACQGAIIDGSVFLRAGVVTREVDLSLARIGRVLDCSDGSFLGKADALTCVGTRVGGHFVLTPRRVEGTLIFAGMHVAELKDNNPARSGAHGKLWLDGLIYDRFASDATKDGDERTAWLHAQLPSHLETDFRPQPWEQAISVLRAMGHPEAARTLAIRKQEQLRKADQVIPGGRWLHWLYGRLVGYGYKPRKVLISIAVVWSVCTLAYWAAVNPAWFGSSQYLLAPPRSAPGSDCLIARALARSGDPCPAPAADYRNFVAPIYATDVLLPIISLGYKDEWQPVVADHEGRPLIWGQLLRFLYWFEIAFGWVAGLLLAGVVGSLIKKD